MENGYVVEQVPMDKDFAFRLFFMDELLKEDSRKLHRHDCWEINYIVRGTGAYYIEDEKVGINEGDIYLFHNMIYHKAATTSDIRILVITFDPKILWTGQNDYCHIIPFYKRKVYFKELYERDTVEYGEVKTQLQKLLKEYKKKDAGYPVMIQSCLLNILMNLYRFDLRKGNIEKDGPIKLGKYERIRPVLEYLSKHYAERVTMDQITRGTGLSKTSITCCFREVMSCTVFEYLDSLRISKSCMDLRASSNTITDVALTNGFNSSSYFNRVFKKYIGVSPREYRNRP